MTPLDKPALKALRQRAHALKPVVRLGQHGLTEAVLAELDIALAHHELVKVKLAADNDAARRTQLQGLMDGASAVLVQRIGHTATLYRKRPATTRPTARKAPPQHGGPRRGAPANARRR